jgi:hypothetical protein
MVSKGSVSGDLRKVMTLLETAAEQERWYYGL